MEYSYFSLQGQRGLAGDVGVLLHYLSALPEARLDAAFAGVSATGPSFVLNRPPTETNTKDILLNKLMVVNKKVAEGDSESDVSPNETSGPLPPADIAFLISARDFLASLARPATVESIRITREYGRTFPLRMIFEWILWPIGWLTGRRRKPSEPVGQGERRSAIFGRGLAKQVFFWQCFTLVLVGLTVMLSIYALTGRGLVQEVGLTETRFSVLATDIEAAEKADAPVFLTFLGAGAERGVRLSAQNETVPKPGHHIRRYCEEFRTTEDQKHKLFATRQQQRLCDRYNGYNVVLQGLFERLQYWNSHETGGWIPFADTCPRGQIPVHNFGECAVPKREIASPHVAGSPARSAAEPVVGAPTRGPATDGSAKIASANVGTIAGATTAGAPRAVAGEGREADERVRDETPARADASTGPTVLSPSYQLHLLQGLRLEMVTAQVILRATTEYLLPCLYAMLGALAAVLGNLARRAEDATLSFNDGGVIFRTLVLGLLFGAVIGLFSSQVGPAGEGAAAGTAAASLTPAALALLAGYSVAQVFQFFDGMSVRVFGPRSPAGTPTG